MTFINLIEISNLTRTFDYPTEFSELFFDLITELEELLLKNEKIDLQMNPLILYWNISHNEIINALIIISEILKTLDYLKRNLIIEKMEFRYIKYIYIYFMLDKLIELKPTIKAEEIFNHNIHSLSRGNWKTFLLKLQSLGIEIEDLMFNNLDKKYLKRPILKDLFE